MDRREHGPLPDGDEVRGLHQALEGLRFSERASFAPELHAELERAWVARRPPARRSLRGAWAAAVAAVLLGTLVPPVRASFVRFVQTLQSVEPVAAPGPEPLPIQPPAAAETAPVDGVESVPDARPQPAPEPLAAGEALLDARDVGGPTAPRLIDPVYSQELLRREYPVALQQAGVGGVVWLRLWVDSTGRADLPVLSQTSGVEGLDAAALRVAPALEFTPGLLRGRPVGTWVEFSVRFEPHQPEAPPSSERLNHRLVP